MAKRTGNSLQAHLAAMDMVLLALVARGVAGSQEPVGDAARLLGAAERMLQASADAATGRARAAALDALDAYEGMCMRVLAYVAEQAYPEPAE
ncbi:hypothetical protein J2X65_001673 [Ancylobacter sp. 3268]|uniref:hypothetical protein n=1 Tax=Ancylobacter sp. 3268 TaxID=2817752 RepID=UPI0028612482|nr:hypothetical protein [Ancylobacter sp. 3268]MDR6952318.1 hypothetical protein [Ancylobacter sp. 3268]